MLIDDFKDESGNWVKAKRIDSKLYKTKACNLWDLVNLRCSANWQQTHPTYKGCTNKFENFQVFAEWCNSQLGYNKAGYQLDKDILSSGEKCYSKEHCVFVPAALNKFLHTNQVRRGEFPLGVSKGAKGKYRMSLSNGFGKTFIRTCNTVEEAANLYKRKKESIAKELATFYNGSVDKRVIDFLMNFKVENQ